MCKIHGIVPENFSGTIESAKKFYHHEDIDMIENRMKKMTIADNRISMHEDRARLFEP